ncbi:MAG: S41 family peptidase, partial [Acutalibacteraceae bacterium]|nr:S41 family peptidase [Acutalibacteraceae bacterium]
ASEIFANAVRDFDRGAIIGEKTFGKGIMQTTYTLTDKSAVKFTTAYVVDKNGETYHEKGIEPDIKVTLPDEINERYYFMTDDEDTQLQAAVDYLAKSIK